MTSDLVRSYVLVEFADVQVGTSDMYLRMIMHDLGLAPRNNWVDFSNVFMYLTGQPIHFFDADKIEGKITVRQAKAGEEFTDLFDTVHTLHSDDVLITDDKKILALAGVVGGKNSGVDEHTTRIVAEIGNFDDVAVRKTAMRCGLRTDAQVRFEKNINPLFSLHAVLMLVDEMKYFEKSLGGATMV